MSLLTRIQSGCRVVARRLGYELIPVRAGVPKDIRDDYDSILERIGEYRFKFLDVKTFVPLTMHRAHKLGLHTSSPLDVLDIGTGVAYFPVICDYYGHRAIGLDRDGNDVFMDATRWLGVDRRSWEIHSFEPLPDLGRRFDLVTAFMVNFDRTHLGGEHYEPWTEREWEFFLRDIALRQLKPGGRLVMVLNGHTLALPVVLDYFRQCEARISNDWVVFETMRAFMSADGSLATARDTPS